MFVGVVVNNFQKVRRQIEAEVAIKKRELKARKLLERLQTKSESKKRGKKYIFANSYFFYFFLIHVLNSVPTWNQAIFSTCRDFFPNSTVRKLS